MDAYEVATLADEVHTKRLIFEAQAMRNAYGLSADEARQATIAYHVAEAELIQAVQRLEAAKFRCPSSPSK